MSVSAFGRIAWRQLGGADAALDAIGDVSPPPALPCVLPAGTLLADSVALAALGVQLVQLERGQRSELSPIALDGRRLTASAQCERHLRIDGVAPDVWSPLSGFWRTADGWVRTHGNYPHHAQRLADLLGVPSDAGKTEVAAAIARRGAEELETAAADVGAVVGAVRSADAWTAHPEGRAIARDPIVLVRVASAAPLAAASPLGEHNTRSGAPLDGIRVLDLTRVLAGPVATRDLAFAGADVLRVDSPRLPEIEWQHRETGHGKRSTRLDLADTADRRTFEELLAEADVVVTGYRPGSLDRYGLSPEALPERRPDLVIGSVGAWSIDGPWRGRRGFDSIAQAVTGVAMATSADGETPGALPAQVLDHSAGHLLAAAVCTALVRRHREGTGSHVRVGLAGLARELLRMPSPEGAAVEKTDQQPEQQPGQEPAVQTGESAAGVITTALPPFGFPGGPDRYPVLSSPWGADAAAWR